MKVRELPGAFALGLLASVLGHTAAYGNGHAMGGPYHGALLTLVDAGAGSFVLAAVALAWAGARGIADGSVLAGRLARYLPGLPLLTATTVGWYQLFESIEGAHSDDSVWLIGIALTAAVLFVRWIARSAIAAIAALVLAVFRREFARRSPIWMRSHERRLPNQGHRFTRKRFARPPPCAASRA